MRTHPFTHPFFWSRKSAKYGTKQSVWRSRTTCGKVAHAGDKCDLYSVLGLKKNCSPFQLRNAYKKLALRWHPDRCSSSGDLNFIEESKKNFQAVQEAYSVLSDENKRMLYDVGVYNNDDDENGMGDFLGEMVVMMRQTNLRENGEQSFEELQNLFQEMFHKDEENCNPSSYSSSPNNSSNHGFSCSSYNDNFNNSNKKNCSSISTEKTNVDFNMESFDFRSFCVGMEGNTQVMNSRGKGATGRRTGRKQKLSSRKDMSSHDSKILA